MRGLMLLLLFALLLVVGCDGKTTSQQSGAGSGTPKPRMMKPS